MSFVLSVVLTLVFFALSAQATDDDLARIQSLFQNTPQDSPFRVRLETRLQALLKASCESELKSNEASEHKSPAVYEISDTLIVEVSGSKLTVRLFDLNPLDELLMALQLGTEIKDPEQAFKIKRVGLFEVTKRLRPEVMKHQPLRSHEIAKLAEILRLSVLEVFLGFRTPVSFPALNPIRGVVHAVFFDRTNLLTPDARYVLASALLAGIVDQDYADFPDYFRPLHRAWLEIGRKGWLGDRRSSSYDAIICTKTAKL